MTGRDVECGIVYMHNVTFILSQYGICHLSLETKYSSLRNFGCTRYLDFIICFELSEDGLVRNILALEVME